MKKLFNLIRADEKKVQKIILKDLKKLGYKIHANRDKAYIYGTHPDSPELLLVSHTDTVLDTEPKQLFHDKEQGVVWSPFGLGADDRAGVYAILEIIKKKRVDVLFCTGEERGGLGAGAFIRDYPENPRYNMLVELDRHGLYESVFYDNNSPDFQAYIEAFGYHSNFGSFSDISVIAPHWKANAVNLSIGYYHQHTDSEYLNLNHMQVAIKTVFEILKGDIPAFKYDEIDWDKYYAGRYGDPYYEYCDVCDKMAVRDTLLEVDYYFVCETCAEGSVVTCPECKEDRVIRRGEVEQFERFGVCYDCLYHYYDEGIITPLDNLVQLRTKTKTG